MYILTNKFKILKALQSIIYKLLVIGLITHLSACANLNLAQNNKANIIKTIEGKFHFKGNTESGSGLFTWQYYGDKAWILTLQTPIATNFARVTSGNINLINDFKLDSTPIYTWEQLPLTQQGINLDSPTFADILLSINNKTAIEKIVNQQQWQLNNYSITAQNVNLELKQGNKSLRLFILNN